jgi:hypothetical protein
VCLTLIYSAYFMSHHVCLLALPFPYRPPISQEDSGGCRPSNYGSYVPISLPAGSRSVSPTNASCQQGCQYLQYSAFSASSKEIGRSTLRWAGPHVISGDNRSVLLQSPTAMPCLKKQPPPFLTGVAVLHNVMLTSHTYQGQSNGAGPPLNIKSTR